MKLTVSNDYDFDLELRRQAEGVGVPLHSERVTPDLMELVEETYVRGILSECLPPELEEIAAAVTPVWSREPLVQKVTVALTGTAGHERISYSQQYDTGRWARTAQLAAVQLRQEGSLGQDEAAYRLLVATRPSQPPALRIPPPARLTVVDQTLDSFGIRSLGSGNLTPDRPVVVNHRLVEDAVRKCEESGTQETGGAVLGKLVRLPEPLPGTHTRIVTILSTTVDDPRHVGAPLSFAFSPEGLVEAARIADLRGSGETVQTVYHTHGWSTKCSNCNQNGSCPLADAVPSLQDYELLESLFSSKATLMPIAGRKQGAQERRPVLQIHAWRGGEMRPIRWQEYFD